MKLTQKSIMAGLVLTVALASCSMRQEIYIQESGAGRVSVDIELADYLTEVVTQVQGLVETEEPRPADAPFFDTEAISKDFDEREGVTLESLESPTGNDLTGSFRFDDINALYQTVEEGSAERRLISLEDQGDLKLLKVSITRETFQALLDENPSMNNALVVNFGPTANEGLSETDYLDMMEFALGSESRQGIVDSRMELIVTVEGTVVEQTGGTVIDGSTVRYDIPLLPVLLLNEPLEYSLRYR